MDCKVIYGLSRSLKHEQTVPAAEAFRMIPKLEKDGWMFIDIYHKDRLVYTNQGLAGYRFICENCPYN